MRRFFNVFIIILNFSIMIGKLYLFNYLGWITLHPTVQGHTLEDSLLTAAAIALVFFPMVYVIEFVYSISFFLSFFLLAILGLGDFAMGLASWLNLFVTIGAGYVALRMVAAIAPAFLSVTDNFWIGCLAGCILLYLWIPYLSSDKASPVGGSTGEIGQHAKPVWVAGSVNMLPQEVANEQKAIVSENGEKTSQELELGDEPRCGPS